MGYGTGNLPLPLNAVAKGLGAVDIRYLAREVHGLTDFVDSGAVVYLAMSRSDGRRRFTLAHECGHLLLGEAGANARVDPYVTLDLLLDIENTCDRIASELVLPRVWLELHRGAVTDLLELRRLARRMRVSPAALVVGLRRVGMNCALVRFQRAPDGGWVTVHKVGLPRSLSGRVDPSRATSRRMAETAQWDESRLAELELVDGSGYCHSYDAYLTHFADSAMAFIPDAAFGRRRRCDTCLEHRIRPTSAEIEELERYTAMPTRPRVGAAGSIAASVASSAQVSGGSSAPAS